MLGQLVGPVKLINNPKQIVIAHSASTPPVQADLLDLPAGWSCLHHPPLGWVMKQGYAGLQIGKGKEEQVRSFYNFFCPVVLFYFAWLKADKA